MKYESIFVDPTGRPFKLSNDKDIWDLTDPKDLSTFKYMVETIPTTFSLFTDDGLHTLIGFLTACGVTVRKSSDTAIQLLVRPHVMDT